MLPALAGANLIYGLGMLEMGMTFSFGQLVADNEMAKMIKHALRGVPVSDETLAVDAIRATGAFGDFLGHDSTLRHMRSVQSLPTLFDRNTREDWQQAGGTDLAYRAAEKAHHILDHHRPEPLSQSVLDDLRSIISEEERVCGVTK